MRTTDFRDVGPEVVGLHPGGYPRIRPLATLGRTEGVQKQREAIDQAERTPAPAQLGVLPSGRVCWRVSPSCRPPVVPRATHGQWTATDHVLPPMLSKEGRETTQERSGATEPGESGTECATWCPAYWRDVSHPRYRAGQKRVGVPIDLERTDSNVQDNSTSAGPTLSTPCSVPLSSEGPAE